MAHQRKIFIIALILVLAILGTSYFVINFDRSWVKWDETSLKFADSSSDRHFHPQNEISIHCNDFSGGGKCIDTVGVVGHWEYTPNRKPLVSPQCCDEDPTSTSTARMYYNLSSTTGESSIQCATRNWRFFQGQTNAYQENGGYECSCPDYVDKYTWKSPDLPDEFDANKTCELLGAKRVLFLGDSTVRQVASHLINALFPAACQTQISYQMCDTLINELFRFNNRGNCYWTNAVLHQKPDIVIVGVGPHLNSTQNYTKVVDRVVTEMIQLRNASDTKHISFVWKTQHPRGCTHDILMPNNPVQASREPVAWKFQTPATHEYHDWDLYLLSRLQEANFPYLDMRMLYSRSDAHPSCMKENSTWTNKFADCLHICTPGPLDIIAPLFQKLLTSI